MPTPDQPLTVQEATSVAVRAAINFAHCRIALLAPTIDRGLNLMLAGALLANPETRLLGAADGRPFVRFGNGSTVTLYSLANPERLRGPQFHLGWVHEPPDDAEDEAMRNLRLGVRLAPKEDWVGFDAGRIITSSDTVIAEPASLPRVARLFLGEPVHYQAHGSADGTYPPVCRAATVTEVGQWCTVAMTAMGEPLASGPYLGHYARSVQQVWLPDAVGLHVTNPTGVFINTGIEYDGAPTGRRGGTWHYDDDCR